MTHDNPKLLERTQPLAEKTYHGHVTFTHKTTVNAWTVRIEATGLVFEGIGETRSQALHSASRNISSLQPPTSGEPQPKHSSVPTNDFTRWLHQEQPT